MFLDGKNADYWLLGDAFLRAYLTIYDRTNNKIGFVGNLKKDPSDDFFTTFDVAVLIALSSAVCLLISIMTICCCCYCRKQNQKKPIEVPA